MKLNSKKTLYILILAIITYSIFLPNTILAVEGTPELNIEASKEKLKPGEEFTASVNFSDNGSIQCYGFDFGLKYDKDILEVVDTKILISEGISTITDKTPGSVDFVLISISPVQAKTTLFTVTFRVKQEANAGKTTLNISPDNSKTPIEDENGEVETIIKSTSIEIDSETKENGVKTNNNSESDSNSSDENLETSTQNKTVIRLDEEDNDLENSTTETNGKTSTSQNNTQTGLPTVVVVTLVIITVAGISIIIMILKKTKK